MCININKLAQDLALYVREHEYTNKKAFVQALKKKPHNANEQELLRLFNACVAENFFLQNHKYGRVYKIAVQPTMFSNENMVMYCDKYQIRTKIGGPMSPEKKEEMLRKKRETMAKNHCNTLSSFSIEELEQELARRHQLIDAKNKLQTILDCAELKLSELVQLIEICTK